MAVTLDARTDKMRDAARRVADRLDDEAIAALLDAYRDGTTARARASRYQLGLSTVKRLLRTNGVRRQVY